MTALSELSNDTIISINRICDEINHFIYFEKDGYFKSQFDSFFQFTRYQANFNHLILDALARYLIVLIKQPSNYGMNVCAFIVKSVQILDEDNDEIFIKEIAYSSNYNKKELIDKLNMVFNTTNNDNSFSGLFIKMFSIENVNPVELDIKLNRDNNNNENQTKIQNLINQLKTTGHYDNIKNYFKYVIDNNKIIENLSEILRQLRKLLNLMMDIYLITKLPDMCVDDFFRDINRSFTIIGEDSNKNKSFHCESKLALNLYLNNINLNYRYIGISKLCCFFCAKLLNILGYSFRGNHKSTSNAFKKWSIGSAKYASDYSSQLVEYWTFLDNLKNQLRNNINNTNIREIIKPLLIINNAILDDSKNHGRHYENSSFEIEYIQESEFSEVEEDSNTPPISLIINYNNELNNLI